MTGIFQPHLYTRTRDFAADFAESLSLLDELILLDIYPAREEPIEGVTSRIIFDKVALEKKILCSKEELLEVVRKGRFEVILMAGAGDIDRLTEPIKRILENTLPFPPSPAARRFKDLRGVACPMNFVHTKIQLSAMQSGEELEILLDDGQPINNVTRSVLSEGHQVLEQNPIDTYWKVIIKKG
ncbi:UDP-N-acetylmuramate--L-alanine ligase [Bacteroidales bacterium Barb4]|nr:UDP-N-acetylmuramate--L-alanine ligase [Bacteroidales bacterium Barb4]